MKKLLLIATIALLPSCSSPAQPQAELTRAPVFLKGAESPFEVQLKGGNGEAATGYELTGSFSMARMDHGQMDVPLKETAPGTYSGVVALPMGGEWDIAVKGSGSGQNIEQTLTVKVNDGG